jgi:hypothetical protein
MLPRLCNGRLWPLLLLVATMAALLAGCSVTTQPPEPSWWAAPWPYFLVSALALLAGAVLWFVERQIALRSHNRLGGFEKQAAPSDWQLDDLKQSERLDPARLNELQTHISTEIETFKKDASTRTQATEGALRLNAADVEADQALAQLDRALRLQKDRIDHLTIQLIDLFAQTQAEATSEVVVWFEPRSVAGEPANEGASDDEKADGTDGGAGADGAMSDGNMQVEVNIFAIGTGRGQPVQENLVVVQRVIERAIQRDDAGETDPSAHNDRDAPLTEQEPGPFEKVAADRIVDPVWERVEESWWVTSDYQGLADGAKWVLGVENGWHDLVFGKPAERVALGAGFSPPSAEMIGVIAAKVGLPGDNAFKDVRRLLQCTGIALGLASDAAALANACLRSLAHDLLAHLMAMAFREAIREVLEPVRSEVRPIPARERGPEGARARQLHSDLVAAEPRQRAHELEMRERETRERQADERDSMGRWAPFER